MPSRILSYCIRQLRKNCGDAKQLGMIFSLFVSAKNPAWNFSMRLTPRLIWKSWWRSYRGADDDLLKIFDIIGTLLRSHWAALLNAQEDKHLLCIYPRKHWKAWICPVRRTWTNRWGSIPRSDKWPTMINRKYYWVQIPLKTSLWMIF